MITNYVSPYSLYDVDYTNKQYNNDGCFNEWNITIHDNRHQIDNEKLSTEVVTTMYF